MRLYLDTSIPNFLFAEDAPDKRTITQQLFAQILAGRHQACFSSLYVAEVAQTSSPLLRYQLEGIPKIYGLEILAVNRQAEELARQYIAGHAFTAANSLDALHVAVAVIEGLEVVVSWNFKHIVRAWTIQKVNALNQQLGLSPILICSPWEVVEDDA